VLCVFLLLLLPFRMGGKQSRLPGGVHVPLALLAAVGVDRFARAATRVIRQERLEPIRSRLRLPAVARRMRPSTLQSALCIGYLGAAVIGTGAILHRHWSEYATHSPAYFQSSATQELYEYLDRLGDDQQVTLGGPVTASWAPALADTRTYHGHWHLTLDAKAKRAGRDWFFTGEATPEQRASWLAAHGITWVIWYPWEWDHRTTSLDDVPGLERMFAREEIVLYRYVGRRQR
jgi:hypothetical protein